MLVCMHCPLGHAHAQSPNKRAHDSTYVLVARTQNTYEIEWYERKAKKNDDWGQMPAFKLTVGGYTQKRKPYPMKSLEPLSAFIPVCVQCVNTSTLAEPKLTKASMVALRGLTSDDGAARTADNEMNGEAIAEEEGEILPKKKSRKRRVIVDDPE